MREAVSGVTLITPIVGVNTRRTEWTVYVTITPGNVTSIYLWRVTRGSFEDNARDVLTQWPSRADWSQTVQLRASRVKGSWRHAPPSPQPVAIFFLSLCRTICCIHLSLSRMTVAYVASTLIIYRCINFSAFFFIIAEGHEAKVNAVDCLMYNKPKNYW